MPWINSANRIPCHVIVGQFETYLDVVGLDTALVYHSQHICHPFYITLPSLSDWYHS